MRHWAFWRPTKSESAWLVPLVGGPAPRPGQTVSEEMRRDLASFIDRNQATLALLHKAAELTDSRYPLTGDNPSGYSSRSYINVQQSAILLRWAGVYYSINGESDRAFQAIISGFAVARTLHNEPLLVPELTRITCVANALTGLEYLASAHRFSNDQLVLLSKLLEEAEADGKVSGFRALVGERAWGIAHFTLPKKEFYQQMNAPVTFGDEDSLLPTATEINGMIYRLLDVRPHDLRLYLDTMNGLIAAMTNDLPNAFRRSTEVETNVNQRLSKRMGRLAIFSEIVLPAMCRLPRKEAALITRLRCARTALAIERFRLAHAGAMPTSIQEVVPEFLPFLPSDPVAGEVLVLKEEPDRGYQVSSPAAAAKLDDAKTTQFRVLR